MLQRVDSFHDDVKLVLVYSFLTRAMLKNMQNSPIGKHNFPELMKHAFAWFSQIRQKELLFSQAIPEVEQFVKEKLTIRHEFESEMVNSLAELSFYIITHAADENLHETIAFITNPSYRKDSMRKAWKAGIWNRNEKLTAFEDWYKDNYEHDTAK